MTPVPAPFDLKRFGLNLLRFAKRVVRQVERRNRYRRLGWI
ncbi:MAG: hypothetical protein ACYDD1_09710 [Caulobacteraceae bacterium]